MVSGGDIVDVTGIDGEVLSGQELESFSVAKRMVWASRRRSTRIEDTTYSFMSVRPTALLSDQRGVSKYCYTLIHTTSTIPTLFT